MSVGWFRVGLGVQSCGFRVACGCVGGFLRRFRVGLKLVWGVFAVALGGSVWWVQMELGLVGLVELRIKAGLVGVSDRMFRVRFFKVLVKGR